MSASSIDYDALAQQHGGTAAPAVDYDALASQHGGTASPDQTPDKPRGWLDSVKDAASEYWKQVNPVAGLRGLSQAVSHPIDTGKSLLLSQADVEKKAEASFKAGNYGEGVRHVLNYLIPVLGPQIDRAGDQAEAGDYAKAAGTTLGIATNIAAPELIKGAQLKVPGAAPLAERMYQSALKPSTASYSGAEVKNMVQTGLNNDIPISAQGAQKLSDLISDLQNKVKAKIASNPDATINKYAVASRLGDAAQKFSTQVNPEADLNTISESGNEFLRNQPGEIPAPAAQDLKSGTYRQLNDKAYGELSSAAEESQKALARGLKEELEVHFPEIKGLNAQEGQFINLRGALEKAVKRIDNRDIFSLGGKIGTGLGLGAGAATGHAGAGAISGLALHYVLTDPAVQSRLAMAINKAARGSLTVAQSQARVAGYANALGNSLTANADNSNSQMSSPQR